MKPATSLQAILHSKTFFCVFTAFLMVTARLVFFDFDMFFGMVYVPNHDMYQGASFFTTSMHSVRTTGDIVWWNPATKNGYAQYYQSFLSPLSPTSSHIVFILWAQFVVILNWIKVSIPEYLQYLIVNFVILPFLTFWAFAYFTQLIFRRRATIFLVVTIYTFSSIGLWNSAWFYFQEPFSLFLLLAGFIGFLKQPGRKTLAFLLAAVLIQVASFNYWTAFNFWVILIVAGTYGLLTYSVQSYRAYQFLQKFVWEHKRQAISLMLLILGVIAIWLVLLGATVLEQADYYSRTSDSSDLFTTQEAFEQAKTVNEYTTQLFDSEAFYAPDVQTNTFRTMHAAGYIGGFLVPLLAVLPLFHWRRREKWLLISAVGILIICLAPPFLLRAWEWTPFMSRIRHLFRFYPYYWRILVVLLGGASFELLLNYSSNSRKEGRQIQWVMIGLAAIAALTLLGIDLFSGSFTAASRSQLALLILLPSIFAWQMLAYPTPANRRLFIAVLLSLAFADLSRYFWVVSRLDSSFTASRWKAEQKPLSASITESLRSPWKFPVDKSIMSSLYDNMPVANDFWPQNNYMVHRYLSDLPVEIAESSLLLGGPFLDYHESFEILPATQESLARVKENPDRFVGKLLLHQNPPPTPAVPMDIPSNGSGAGSDPGQNIPIPFGYNIKERTYNSLTLDVDMPQNGWISYGQLYDPAWKVTVDGRPVQAVRANFVRSAVSIPEGRHEIRMDYRPFARKIYWPACFVLELVLLVLVCVYYAFDPRKLGRPLNQIRENWRSRRFRNGEV